MADIQRITVSSSWYVAYGVAWMVCTVHSRTHRPMRKLPYVWETSFAAETIFRSLISPYCQTWRKLEEDAMRRAEIIARGAGAWETGRKPRGGGPSEQMTTVHDENTRCGDAPVQSLSADILLCPNVRAASSTTIPHMREHGSERAEDRARIPLTGGERASHYSTAVPGNSYKIITAKVSQLQHCQLPGSGSVNTTKAAEINHECTRIICMRTFLSVDGATLAKRFDCSPPTKMNRVLSPAGSFRIFAIDASDRWVSSGISRSPRPFIPAMLHTHLNHLAVRSRPNLFTRFIYPDTLVKVISRSMTWYYYFCLDNGGTTANNRSGIYSSRKANCWVASMGRCKLASRAGGINIHGQLRLRRHMEHDVDRSSWADQLKINWFVDYWIMHVTPMLHAATSTDLGECAQKSIFCDETVFNAATIRLGIYITVRRTEWSHGNY
ncbi:hypothetical protein PR048_023544 [Dryococelus australis]|uniref:Uncharacterized protein n=1 Tax=Dryococelus australis TaxID=614101 RepID=A0ABQ9GUF3_9NEOP|nr:hypothetical protein PR048_023544 [Dryococelus australis]